jgi:hypothetical protein
VGRQQRRPIPATQRPRAGREGAEEHHQSGGTRIRGVGKVGAQLRAVLRGDAVERWGVDDDWLERRWEGWGAAWRSWSGGELGRRSWR